MTRVNEGSQFLPATHPHVYPQMEMSYSPATQPSPQWPVPLRVGG